MSQDGVYQRGVDHFQQRDDAILALMSNAGPRVGELTTLGVDYLRDERTKLFLPSDV